MGGVSSGRDAMTQLWVVAVPKCLQDCVVLLGPDFSCGEGHSVACLEATQMQLLLRRNQIF